MTQHFVLGKPDPQAKRTVFVAGSYPRAPFFTQFVAGATHFDTPETALAYREQMPFQLGGTDKYVVYEVLAGEEVRPLRHE